MRRKMGMLYGKLGKKLGKVGKKKGWETSKVMELKLGNPKQS